MVVLTQQ
jgi:phosphatidylglycerophosphate synthase